MIFGGYLLPPPLNLGFIIGPHIFQELNSEYLKYTQNKARAISAKLLEVNLKNKLDEKRKKKNGLEETEKNGETGEKKQD